MNGPGSPMMQDRAGQNIYRYRHNNNSGKLHRPATAGQSA